jgi:hypothetical protein
LDELRPADLRTLIAEQVALPYVLPLAVRLLIEEPLLDAYCYEGDLLLAAVNAPASALLPELCARLRTVITTAPETVVAGLPRGAAEELARFLGKPAPFLRPEMGPWHYSAPGVEGCPEMRCDLRGSGSVA